MPEMRNRAAMFATSVRGDTATTTRRRDDPTPRITPIGDTEWMRRAACTDADPSLFSSDEGFDRAERELRITEAHTWCAACPVTDECLAAGLAAQATAGALPLGNVHGGLHPDEVWNMYRQRRSKRRNAQRRAAKAQARG